MMDFPILTIITLLPLLGGLILVGLNASQHELARKIAIGFSFAALALALVLWKAFDPTLAELQFTERANWIPALGAQYFVGVDGLGLLMVLLTTIVVPMALLASGKLFEANSGGARNPHLYYALILFLQAGLFGTFTALNFFHWFLFWELSLIPAFFLVRLWGGPQRSPAAMQFFVYTMVGSILFAIAI